MGQRVLVDPWDQGDLVVQWGQVDRVAPWDREDLGDQLDRVDQVDPVDRWDVDHRAAWEWDQMVRRWGREE